LRELAGIKRFFFCPDGTGGMHQFLIDFYGTVGLFFTESFQEFQYYINIIIERQCFHTKKRSAK
jgi:hypothetical protein